VLRDPEPQRISRRVFLKSTAVLALTPGCAHLSSKPGRALVNDIQSGLNPTHVEKIVTVGSLPVLRGSIQQAAVRGKAVSVCGGRHAMGGQQFLTDGILLDTTGLDKVLKFNPDEGTIEVEAGIQWPSLLKHLLKHQRNPSRTWTFAQKQTGANRFCIGGSLGSNIHGRGLTMKPFISNIDSFTLVDAAGDLRQCSRKENSELFRAAIGGYGLFGPVYSVKLRLVPRRKLQRIVEFLDLEDLMPAFARRIENGFVYGDFQFSIDPASNDYLRRGIFSCYQPVGLETPIAPRKKLSTRAWQNLLYGAHVQPTRAFEEYSRYYHATSGNIYWSDLLQFNGYQDDYHAGIDRRTHAPHPASEIITEIFVPRDALLQFMAGARDDFRKNNVQIIYGTIRLIERDEESLLTWAREPHACVIFNIHTPHTEQGIQHSAAAFRRLIDSAIHHHGSYYLTYHKYASRQQMEACYPQLNAFLALKRKFDPEERFQSDWYRHYNRQSH
jgi:FAD/FMN-containing dehydrogenase